MAQKLAEFSFETAARIGTPRMHYNRVECAWARARVSPSRCWRVCLCGLLPVAGVRAPPTRCRRRLADDEFWRIVQGFSERAGTFPSDNLLSNERWLQTIIPELTRKVQSGGVYLGVGPEQNFTYMVALRPRMAFIFDIRRGNMALHLIYKALFEMSADRAEFVSRLFARKRPAGLTASSTIAEIFDAFSRERIVRIVVRREREGGREPPHAGRTAFVLDADDLLRLQHDYRAFHLYGPKIQYSSNKNGGRRGSEPTYADLMAATDGSGELRALPGQRGVVSVPEAARNRQSGRAR